MSHDHHDEKQSPAKTLVTDIYIDIIIVSALAIYAFRTPVPTFFYGFCLCFTIVSMLFWILSRIHLGGSFSVLPEAKTLIKTGIYSKIRHPIYFFSTLALLGIAFYLNSLLAYALLAILVLLQIERIRKEDALLEEKFGAEFVTYKETTWF
jgi:protein-S-isoprenylcysteine O-methyltransferase Ste14